MEESRTIDESTDKGPLTQWEILCALVKEEDFIEQYSVKLVEVWQKIPTAPALGVVYPLGSLTPNYASKLESFGIKICDNREKLNECYDHTLVIIEGAELAISSDRMCLGITYSNKEIISMANRFKLDWDRMLLIKTECDKINKLHEDGVISEIVVPYGVLFSLLLGSSSYVLVRDALVALKGRRVSNHSKRIKDQSIPKPKRGNQFFNKGGRRGVQRPGKPMEQTSISYPVDA